MTPTIVDAPVAERVWESMEATLSGGHTPPLRVLFATDGSEPARAAAHMLSQLPLPAGSSIRVMTVLDAQVWQVPDSLRGAEQEWAQRITEEARAGVARQGVSLDEVIPRGAPACEIIDAADRFNADLIVVGSQGLTGIEGFLVGSVARNVAKHARRPVLVARAPAHQFRQVIVAIDRSEHAEQAVTLAAHLPVPEGAELTLCHVVKPYYPVLGPEPVTDLDVILREVREQQQKAAEELLAAAAATLARWGKRVDITIREGDPAAEILKLVSEREADLVVLGARGVSPIHALLLGSVADRMLKTAPCSVLVVR